MNGASVSLQTMPQGYRPTALYYHDSDCVEYVKEDSFAIYDRVDEYLTLVYDQTGHILIGFKLKGFKYIFTKALAPAYRLNEQQFLSMASVIEAVCTLLGDDLFKDEKRASAYKAAKKIAANDNVELHDSGLFLAA